MLDNATHGRSPAQKLWFHFKLRRVQAITAPEIYTQQKNVVLSKQSYWQNVICMIWIWKPYILFVTNREDKRKPSHCEGLNELQVIEHLKTLGKFTLDLGEILCGKSTALSHRIDMTYIYICIFVCTLHLEIILYTQIQKTQMNNHNHIVPEYVCLHESMYVIVYENNSECQATSWFHTHI